MNYNALQARFLERDFRARVAEIAFFTEQKLNLKVQFEHNGFPVSIQDVITTYSSRRVPRRWAFIEIVPELGEDYPKVLEQLRKKKKKVWDLAALDRRGPKVCLLAEKWVGTSVTQEQVEAMFRASGFDVIFVEEVES